jgi:hypothetical protein
MSAHKLADIWGPILLPSCSAKHSSGITRKIIQECDTIFTGSSWVPPCRQSAHSSRDANQPRALTQRRSLDAIFPVEKSRNQGGALESIAEDMQLMQVNEAELECIDLAPVRKGGWLKRSVSLRSFKLPQRQVSTIDDHLPLPKRLEHMDYRVPRVPVRYEGPEVERPQSAASSPHHVRRAPVSITSEP